jgi:hypothetical protein
MQFNFRYWVFLLFAFCGIASEAEAGALNFWLGAQPAGPVTVSTTGTVNWNNAPLACLPTRAAPWTKGAQPELCHCPPQNYCPAQTTTITPADVTFNVTLSTFSGTVPNFTISGTDVATYYAQHSLPPFDPTQIFVIPDNPTATICKASGFDGDGWGAIQDYIAPVVKQYLNSQNIDYNSGLNEDGLDSLCSQFDNIMDYQVQVTVTPEIANQINNTNTQEPAPLIAQCCPNVTFACPAGTQAQTSPLNAGVVRGDSAASTSTPPNTTAVSCQVSADTSRLGCLLEGTQVLMADGKMKKVEQIKLGDRLKGYHDDVTVFALNKFTQHFDEMYGFNGGAAFITAEHPLLTKQGWKAVNPTTTKVKSKMGYVGKLVVGDEVITSKGTLKITSIEKHKVGDGTTAYNFSVKGDDGFMANDVVVKGFSQVQIHY